MTATPAQQASDQRDEVLYEDADGIATVTLNRPARLNTISREMLELLGQCLLKADADPAVRVAGGALEGSNVSAVDSMVNMISLARSFETQMSLLKNAENNAAKATQILALN